MSKTLKILSRPKGNAEEYGRWSVNPYLGCSHGCLYCYLKKGPGAKTLGGNIATLKKGVVNEDHAFHLAMAEIIENREEIVKDGGLFMTFTSDPCNEHTYKLFSRISESAREMGIPITMLTKADLPAAYIFCDSIIPSKFLLGNKERETAIHEYLANCQKKASLLAIGFTLTGHDELEPNASTNEERIREIDFLTKRFSPSKECHVWASIEPVIDFESSFEMIQLALDAGCEHFKIGLLTNNTKPCRDKYDVDECVDFINKVMMLTRDKATVYWKQSVRDFIRTSRKPALTDDELSKVFDSWPNSVDKNYSMFTSNDYGK